MVVRGKLNPTKETRAPHTHSKNVKSKRIKSKTKHTHTKDHHHQGGLQLYEEGAQLGGLTTDRLTVHITNQINKLKSINLQ